MKSILKTLQNLWNRIPDRARRVIHTAWQVTTPVLLSHLLIARSSTDVKLAFVAAGAVLLAYLKSVVANQVEVSRNVW
jgi:TRAP-type mannitol/chloroaromatic compound transport system substrate-binding protein